MSLNAIYKVVCSVCLCCFLPTLYAKTSQEVQADAVIAGIYRNLNSQIISKRIQIVSHNFLGKPYSLGALGEGSDGDFDKFPLYRTDAFDCLTYVETVLAVAFATNVSGFQKCINYIRYHDNAISFATRNHFTSLDWNPANQRKGLLKDITKNIHTKNGKKVFKVAQTVIDKPTWFHRLKREDVRIEDVSADKLKNLHNLGNKYKLENAAIPYLPLSSLFDAKGVANDYLFSQIPSGAVIEIVRPNWDLTDAIGTHLNVSHIGFAFWINNELIFRDASLLKKKVVNTRLKDYLRKYIESPTIKGVNVQEVVPKKASNYLCSYTHNLS